MRSSHPKGFKGRANDGPCGRRVRYCLPHVCGRRQVRYGRQPAHRAASPSSSQLTSSITPLPATSNTFDFAVSSYAAAGPSDASGQAAPLEQDGGRCISPVEEPKPAVPKQVLRNAGVRFAKYRLANASPGTPISTVLVGPTPQRFFAYFHVICALNVAAWAGGVGCGGRTAAKGNDNSDAMASADTEAFADHTANEAEAPPPSSSCPSTVPSDGTSCADDGQMCGWGDDVRGDVCRTSAVCTSGRWQVTTPDPQACPPLQPIGTCPADTTASCTNNQICTKADGLFCRCTNCPPLSPLCSSEVAWYCPPPLGVPGCPVAEPNFGTVCETKGAVCQYFLYACGQPARVCSGGKWAPGEAVPCPQ
jgi:hypothetical protein